MRSEVISRQILCETEYLRLIEVTYKNKLGKIETYFGAERVDNTRAILVVAVVEDRLAVIREFRPLLGGYEWSLPAGLIDRDESVYDAAKRELKEETGLDVVSFSKTASPFVVSSSGLSNETSSIVYAVATGEISDRYLSKNEDIQAFLVSKDEVRELLKRAHTNEFADFIGAKAWVYLEQFVKDESEIVARVKTNRQERIARRFKNRSSL